MDIEGSWVAGTGETGIQAPVAHLGCDGALHGAVDDFRCLGSLRGEETLSQCPQRRAQTTHAGASVGLVWCPP